VVLKAKVAFASKRVLAKRFVFFWVSGSNRVKPRSRVGRTSCPALPQDQSMRKRGIAQQPEEGGADCKGALEEPCATMCHAPQRAGLGHDCKLAA